MEPAPESFVDLYWMPVGAGTRFQRLSLLVYEGALALWSRRQRTGLIHAGLKVCVGGRLSTIESAPAEAGPNARGEVTGPVGARWAGRLRLFRYQVYSRGNETFPDEQWAVGAPSRLTTDPEVASRILCLVREVPAHTWGRRRPGHSEMWTSDSTVSWLLVRAGVDAGLIAVPPGYRAPGWRSGMEEAASPS